MDQASPPPSSARLRTWLALALKAAVTLALLGWLVARIDLGAVAARLANLSPPWTAAALVVFTLQLALAGQRWALICRAIGAPLPPGSVQRLNFIGQFFSQTLPSAIGGDAVRAWLASREGLTLAKAIAGVIIDRVVALLVLATVAGVALPLFFARIPDPGPRAFVVTCVAATALGLALFLWQGEAVRRWLAAFRPTRPFAALAEDLARALGPGPLRPALLAIALAVHLGVIATAYLLVRALALEVGILDCLVLIPPIVLLTMLPISIAGWGVREGAMVVGFGFVGVAAGDALALSVALGLAQIAVGLPGGVAWLAAGRPSRRHPERDGPGDAGDERP